MKWRMSRAAPVVGWWSILKGLKLSTCWSHTRVNKVLTLHNNISIYTVADQVFAGLWANTTWLFFYVTFQLSCIFFNIFYSSRCCAELYGRLWQDSDIQQSAPWAKPVLQCTQPARGLHRPLWSNWWELENSEYAFIYLTCDVNRFTCSAPSHYRRPWANWKL